MYIGYLQNQKLLSYTALEDTSCGIKLALITDSTILFIRSFPLSGKSKSKRIMVVICLVVLFICLEVLLISGNASSTEAKDNWFLPEVEGSPIPKSVQSYRRYSDSRPARGTIGKILTEVEVE